MALSTQQTVKIEQIGGSGGAVSTTGKTAQEKQEIDAAIKRGQNR